MLGILSFLAFACGISFVVSVVMLVVRSVKRNPRKPFVILAVVSVVAFLGLSVPISQMYVPPEKPSENLTTAVEKKEPEPSEPSSAPSSNVEKVDKSVNNPVASETTESAKDEQSAAPAENSTVVKKNEPSDAEKKSEDSPEKDSTPVDSSSGSPSEKDTGDDAPAPSLAETYKTDVIIACSMLLDRFLSDYKVSLAPQSWTVADFDSDGAVAASADVKFKSSGSVERCFIVLTPIVTDGKCTETKPHYVAVGSTVYGDDGYYDGVFSKIQEALDSLGGGGE